MYQPSLTNILLATLILFSALAANAADVTISGTARDSSGKALSGVDISILSDPKIKTVSAEDGSFKLTGTLAPAENPTGVPGKILADSVSVTGSKDGLMSVRVLAKVNASALQLTLYPALHGTVNLTGNLLGSSHTLGMGRAANAEHSVFMLAFDGDPGIRAEFDQIIKDYWPGGGTLDADAARELENQFMDRLKINLDGAQFNAMWKEVAQHPYVTAVSITGDVHADPDNKGRRWIAVNRYGSTTFNYPKQMVTPYKPLEMPAKPPLEIRLSDTVSMKLIYVAPGKFYMGCPLYQIPHWEEAPQHMVTLTRGYYMAETPLTYEQYAAITGDNGADTYTNKAGVVTKMKPDSAAGVSCKMFLNFCDLLAKKTNKKVRPPTAAEWEFAARCGVSNPSCSPNGAERIFPVDPLVERDPYASVKSTQPNQWGFYEMKVAKSSERTSDEEVGSASEHKDVVDPHYPVKEDSMDPIPDHGPRDHCCKGSDEYPIQEMMRSGGARGKPFEEEWNNMAKRERVVIEE